jgi:hypothetical protein
MTTHRRSRRAAIVGLALPALLAGCPEDKPTSAAPDAAPAAVRSAATPPAVPSPPAPSPSTASDAGPDAADHKRYDPKYKCPTGQTHFYFDGDFCRRKCLSNSDCAKGERCDPIEYPFLVDGGPGGSARFCEGM